jgi:hypothetical protein
MKEIPNRYVVDEENRRENRALFELMTEDNDKALDLDAAKRYYAGLSKAD